jgi:hypothetical protein
MVANDSNIQCTPFPEKRNNGVFRRLLSFAVAVYWIPESDRKKSA